MIGPLKIGGVPIAPPLALAPMAGISDAHFRLLIRRIGGVGLLSMEFISSEATTRGVLRELEKLRFSDEERPLAIQIYGRDVERMAECAALVDQLQPDLCDINMGCPANKVLKGCAGAALMGDLPRAARMIEACRRNLTIPLTVKMRLGLGKGAQPVNYIELARIAEALGVAAVTLHARTANQMFGGAAQWDEIRRLKDSVSIPVIGNGDVETPEDVVGMFRATGCDGVMIGRAALTDPWIFRRAAAALEGREAPPASLAERREAILTHFRWIVADEEPRFALHKLRTFAGWYTRGIPGGRGLRGMIGGFETPAAFVGAIEAHFAALAAAADSDPRS